MNSLINFALLLLIPMSALAGGKKNPTASISFHLEGNPSDSAKFSREIKTSAGTGHYRIVPEISNRDILAYAPFPSKEDSTYGLIIKLNKQATRRLEIVSTSNLNKLLLSVINGQPHGVVHITQPIKDGTLVIWRGVTLEQIRSCDSVIPRIGEDRKEWKKRVRKRQKTNDIINKHTAN